MLIITRKAGEKIMFGDDVVVEIMEVVGSQVRVGIKAPRSVPVYREELWEVVKAENLAAVDATPADLPVQSSARAGNAGKRAPSSLHRKNRANRTQDPPSVPAGLDCAPQRRSGTTSSGAASG